MKNKKIIFFVAATFLMLLFYSSASAQYNNYVPMENIPGFDYNNADPASQFKSLVEGIYKFGIWTVGLAALLMIIIGGFMYLTSAGNTSKAGNAKEIITDAIYGLIVALFAFLLLFVINPDLTTINLSMTKVSMTNTNPSSGPGNTNPLNPGGGATTPTNPPKTYTPPPTTGGQSSQIVSSAVAMMNSGCIYNQSLRNGCTGNPGYTDCSDLVDATYKKAGCNSPGNNSAVIGSKGSPLTDSSTLKPGDVLAVPGHVVICVQVGSNGCGQVIGAAGVGKNIKYSNVSYYLNQNPRVVKASDYCAS
jgi:hypothetical protein